MAQPNCNSSSTTPLVPTFSDEEQMYLVCAARLSVTKGLQGEAVSDIDLLPKPVSEAITEPRGVYVTLMRHRRLRGALGVYKNPPPLYLGVARMAFAAAFGDRRFTPLDMAEWADMQIEISILGDMCPCTSLNQIVLGEHGLMLDKDGHTALLLPQMPLEQLWDIPTFMYNLYTKLGLTWDGTENFGDSLKYFATQNFSAPSVGRP